MKKFKELVAEIYDYPPTTKDEKEFINMHTIKTFDYPVKNEHGLPFRDDRIKPPGPQHKKLATYEPPKEPTTVYTKANEEVEQVDEARMPPSTIKTKTNLSKMRPKEFANHPHYSKMSDEQLRSMAWRHGYGGPGTPGHDHYVNMRKKGMNEEVDLEERKIPPGSIYHDDEGRVTMISPGLEDVNHPSKPGVPLEHGHMLSSKDISKLKSQGHNVEHEDALDEEVNIKAELSELRSLLGVDPNVRSINETFEYEDMLSILALVSDTDKEVEIFFEESEEGLVIDKEIADILLNVYENLDEESQEKFEAALTLSNESFDYCVDFCSEVLKEEDENEHN